MAKLGVAGSRGGAGDGRARESLESEVNYPEGRLYWLHVAINMVV